MSVELPRKKNNKNKETNSFETIRNSREKKTKYFYDSHLRKKNFVSGKTHPRSSHSPSFFLLPMSKEQNRKSITQATIRNNNFSLLCSLMTFNCVIYPTDKREAETLRSPPPSKFSLCYTSLPLTHPSLLSCLLYLWISAKSPLRSFLSLQS